MRGFIMRDFRGLLKIAGLPYQTVGDFMNRWNGDMFADPQARRSVFDKVNAGGLDVKDRASRIPYVLGGGYLGRQAAKYMGFGGFGRAVGAMAGAAVGNGLFNRINGGVDPMNRSIGNGVVNRGW